MFIDNHWTFFKKNKKRSWAVIHQSRSALRLSVHIPLLPFLFSAWCLSTLSYLWQCVRKGVDSGLGLVVCVEVRRAPRCFYLLAPRARGLQRQKQTRWAHSPHRIEIPPSSKRERERETLGQEERPRDACTYVHICFLAFLIQRWKNEEENGTKWKIRICTIYDFLISRSKYGSVHRRGERRAGVKWDFHSGDSRTDQVSRFKSHTVTNLFIPHSLQLRDRGAPGRTIRGKAISGEKQ